MFCTQCGKKLEGFEFCTNCGAPVRRITLEKKKFPWRRRIIITVVALAIISLITPSIAKVGYEEIIKNIKSSITLYKEGSGPSYPDSNGGVDLYVRWANNSTKVIKNISFTIIPVNASGEVLTSSIENRSTFEAELAGPYKQGEGEGTGGKFWEGVWNNNNITSCIFTKIQIDYTDGTSLNINRNEIQYILK